MSTCEHGATIGECDQCQAIEMETGPVIADITADLVGERREDFRRGFDAGVREGSRRVLYSNALEEMALELTLLRQAAADLARKADYWMMHAQRAELSAEYWHQVAAAAASRIKR
jgi:hypothetical protein